MTDDTLLAFGRAYRERHCTIKQNENDWVFSFGGDNRHTVEVPWRIVQNGRIAFTDQDDGQRFGLPRPIDGEALANSLLAGRRLESLELDRVTADLRLHFDGVTRLDVFNYSSGYEGWQAAFCADGDGVSIIGMGGGDVSIFRHPRAVQNSWYCSGLDYPIPILLENSSRDTTEGLCDLGALRCRPRATQ